LRTIRITAKPSLGFFPKRWEEMKVPVPVHLANILERHTQMNGSVSCFLHRPGIASRICFVFARRSPSESVSIRRRSI
jgi:hypothetical protein